MKKIVKKIIVVKLFLATLFYFSPSLAHADGPTNPILVSLLQHVNAVTEFTSHGETKVEFIDGLIQFGHYKGDYIFAADGGFANSLSPDAQGHLATTWGVHAHVLSAIARLGDFNPNLIQAFNVLELTPRWSYDADVHHGVFGLTFGAKISF